MRKELLYVFNNPKQLPNDVTTIKEQVEKATAILKGRREQNNVRELGHLKSIEASGEIIVIGDLHGDLDSLQYILKSSQFTKKAIRCEEIFLVCLGDYIDRGPNQVEVISTLLQLFIDHPENVILLRGNHEGPKDVKVNPHDFPLSLIDRYGSSGGILYSSFQTLFDHLYTAAIIEHTALLVHGGVPTQASTLEEIAFAHLYHPQKNHLLEILWNDPSTINSVISSPRGIGKLFSLDFAEKFLNQIGVDILIRGHEPVAKGYHVHDGKIITLFSCKVPPYRNEFRAYLHAPMDEKFNVNNLIKHIKVF